MDVFGRSARTAGTVQMPREIVSHPAMPMVGEEPMRIRIPVAAGGGMRAARALRRPVEEDIEEIRTVGTMAAQYGLPEGMRHALPPRFERRQLFLGGTDLPRNIPAPIVPREEEEEPPTPSTGPSPRRGRRGGISPTKSSASEHESLVRLAAQAAQMAAQEAGLAEEVEGNIRIENELKNEATQLVNKFLTVEEVIDEKYDYDTLIEKTMNFLRAGKYELRARAEAIREHDATISREEALRRAKEQMQKEYIKKIKEEINPTLFENTKPLSLKSEIEELGIPYDILTNEDKKEVEHEVRRFAAKMGYKQPKRGEEETTAQKQKRIETIKKLERSAMKDRIILNAGKVVEIINAKELGEEIDEDEALRRAKKRLEIDRMDRDVYRELNKRNKL